jgi:hypothetical protein
MLCLCGSKLDREAHFDGYGIFLFHSCPKCHKEKMSKYRRDIRERYWSDEPIEPDE